MGKDEAAKAGVENHRLYFRTYSDKVNLTPPVEKSIWFKLIGVPLWNGPLEDEFAPIVEGKTTPDTMFTVIGQRPGPGDNVGVVTRWHWPDPRAGVTDADFAKAAVKI